MVGKTDQYNVTLEIACPKCGGHEFRKALIPKGPRTDTVFACRKVYPLRPDQYGIPDVCEGMVCYCKKCEKYYPSYYFLRSKDEYICKECYTVQLEYSEYKRASDYIGSVVNSVRSRFNL